MAFIGMLSLIFVLMLLSLSYFSLCFAIGLTLEIVPPHSPKSPLFIPNLTIEKRMQLLVQQSDSRVQHLSKILLSTFHPNNSGYNLQKNTIPLPTVKKAYDASMVVKVGIGTFNNGAYKAYSLLMDTGGTNIWVQCEDCKQKPKGHCYLQKEDYFPNSKSKSYILMSPPSPYTQIYGDGSNSTGFNAKETFTFPSTSSSPRLLKLRNIILGCGVNNHCPNAHDRNYPISGIFGLGMNKMSFISQIETLSGGRFSYCLVPMDMKNPPRLYLRFGDNIKPPRYPKTIRFLTSQTSAYFVNLVDLGVNQERLQISEKIINSPDIETKGILVDSGTSVSYISKGAYDILVKKLDMHFLKHKEEFKKELSQNWPTYSRIKGSKGYKNLPSVSFYFEGYAQLDLNPEATFLKTISPVGREIFTLVIRYTPVGINILGAFQQVNFKLIYNIKDKTHLGKRIVPKKDN